MALLEARDLWVERTETGHEPILRGIDLDVHAGAVTVLLGETGAGKTLLGRALAGLLPAGMRVSRGRIAYRGRVLATAASWQGVRGGRIFYAPQNAGACLNPVLPIGRQLRECSRLEGRELLDLLGQLQLADPDRVMGAYPCALSGGENQRCLLAMAIASRAEVLILDEPTSEIDRSSQEGFIRVLVEQQKARSLAVLLISHHLGFIREVAGTVAVMSCGEMVAAGPPRAVFASCGHAYVREIAAYLSST
jgi:ABC-type glutathione transport system ATPase component